MERVRVGDDGVYDSLASKTNATTLFAKEEKRK